MIAKSAYLVGGIKDGLFVDFNPPGKPPAVLTVDASTQGFVHIYHLTEFKSKTQIARYEFKRTERR